MTATPTDLDRFRTILLAGDETATNPYADCVEEQCRYDPSLPLAIRIARYFGRTVEAIFHVD